MLGVSITKAGEGHVPISNCADTAQRLSQTRWPAHAEKEAWPKAGGGHEEAEWKVREAGGRMVGGLDDGEKEDLELDHVS